MNILIIEDDQILADRIQKTFELKVASNRVKTLASYESFLEELPNISTYDIVLTDLLLRCGEREFSGYKVIRSIREKDKSIPIVVVSGFSDIEKLQQAFDCGANDYIIKPFRLKELELRISNWFKRYYFSKMIQSPETYSYNNLCYDLDRNEFYFQGNKIPLTRNAKYILSLFFSNPDRLLRDSFLAEKIWGDWRMGSTDGNLRVSILRLKQSLSPFGIDEWIRNIRWEGYMFSGESTGCYERR